MLPRKPTRIELKQEDLQQYEQARKKMKARGKTGTKNTNAKESSFFQTREAKTAAERIGFQQ
jgi:hypothetical protein